MHVHYFKLSLEAVQIAVSGPLSASRSVYVHCVATYVDDAYLHTDLIYSDFTL